MIQSTNNKSKSLDPTLLFLIVFCFIELFGFNSDRFEGSAIIRTIVIPYVDMNLTVVLAALSIVTIALLMISGKRRINNVLSSLLLRVPFYFLPILYISGNFKVGIAYAVIQCIFAYFIGYHFSGKLSKVINIIAVFTLGISAEVYAVLVINGLSIFAPNLKRYMVIPMGMSNYIDTILISSFILVDLFYAHKNSPWVRLLYSLVIGGAVLATGSKLGLVVFCAYFVIETISYLISINKLKKTTALKGGAFALLFLFMLIWALFHFQNEVTLILVKYVQTNIFENRLRVFSDSIKLFFEHPILGRSAYNYTVFDAAKAHNWILESLIQTGIIGSIIYINSLICSIKKIKQINDNRIKRMWRFFVLFYLVHGLAEPNLFGSTSDAFFWLMIGISNCKALNKDPDYHEVT